MAPSSPSAPARPGSSEDGENGGLTRGYSKRGDGFSVQETEGMLQQVRDRWQEGWDVIAELHNAQFPGHKRSASSLKRKFAKLYRFKIDANTKEKHARAAAMAKKVREEMRGQRRGLIGTPALSEDLVAETEVQEVHQDLTEVEMITPQPGSHNHALPEPAVTASEHELRQTLTQSVVMPQETPMRDDAWQAAINRLPVAGDRLRTLRAQIENGETTASQDLVQTVLLVLLESQHQRDLEREQEREERRQEKLRWQEEMREQRRRHEQDRAEDRRKNEQFMQVMTTLVAQIAAGQQQRTGVN
ncbi:hypothetical protein PF005_g22355 [Phytophthora fragariae]|uniref:Uncharacterized protein n=1 Tax=Phytophthora fragariae TaxID=53985 RepID=A0A6A3IPE9_9STRA|nr:hypothetical protein PF003_g37742 [Phytophthora fragariae]KAE8926587.1 hypothetical protein PF009_g23226 [Phytophthora fragariae]KAE8983951.1 hypothetical protein PF011_g20968 [Phytophthora fragariae]KAE9082097.1 hypothetical protein PF010_g21728 [Phytophthora fragariae]KAE9082179.1 hypothetical protein PF007_g22370 [Phytophthora fragariae]